MYKQAIIYYPKDEKIRKQIEKDIAIFHCDAAIKYMDSLNYTIYQKIAVFEGMLEYMRQESPSRTLAKD